MKRVILFVYPDSVSIEIDEGREGNTRQVKGKSFEAVVDEMLSNDVETLRLLAEEILRTTSATPGFKAFQVSEMEWKPKDE